MKILFVSTEVQPFIKTGGLADVAYALPKALKAAGIDVRVILPTPRPLSRSAFPFCPLTASVTSM